MEQAIADAIAGGARTADIVAEGFKQLDDPGKKFFGTLLRSF